MVAHCPLVFAGPWQNVADSVAAVALAKEETWNYEVPTLEEPVATVTIGLDGACILMSDDGWREAMVGTLGRAIAR